ncbi:MAG: bifunctional (p)ppGpp synthetase/guanosine-3',5'-bis(diphosphate) 3'-pyrophosphohydrolase [Tepidibacter sp.]|jgi:GTP pyrophosphokinase|uniref:RelA/SpoT family protein n=1 Tax=Tepidibacter sp. TaxID=2529387 RepID=UPI0025F7EAC7|nr:bifunctional (p)ppGpp synthetase/guanosine-3',5'-bis(diphosphate) 3'-pyrophosphohydrolase [Tepidibacter sp.]MCT4509888.1 bifunctional (p)ppGpp synthetase/guanosine-3',5'-bis(diphosphate) 3'-pyrophosphohydrolase [Tepidibacter sp.]
MVENLLLKIQQYSPNSDLDLIIKAYNFAENAHEGQYRKSGEKYFIHPVEVAYILADLEMDIYTIAAGLMHDVVEDTHYTYEDIAKKFGREIADLVEGVTKLGQIEYKSKEETQAENLRKMFMAMAKDIRVILIKLADRLHNMRTLKFMTPEKAKEKAKETMEIYSPIAHRLGISKIKWELEDIGLRYLDMPGYYELVEKVAKKRKEREAYITKVIDILQERFEKSNIKCDIYGRPKHFYSIYRKMHYQNKSFEEIYDLMAIRALVENVKDCYAVLGIVHTIWKPMPGRFKDYIAMPKPNMYQSLHTTVVGPDGEPLEIQIRTREMHKIAEYGIAAHWKYKQGDTDNKEEDMDIKLSWLRQMMEWQKDLNDPKEFMEALKIDLFTNQVFVFTPRGDVIELPAGSTPIDFAYRVHTGVGNKCIGAKIDGRIVPLDYKLKNGNIVEIIRSSHSNGPSRDWINIVKTSHAKNRIRQWFKKERREENIQRGRDLLEKEVKKQGYVLSEFLKNKNINAISKKFNQPTDEDLYATIGYGGLIVSQVMSKLRELYEKDNKKQTIETKIEESINEKEYKSRRRTSSQGVVVKDVDNILVRIARCCNPLPGDDIIGYITKGRGVSVHRKDCPNIDINDTDKANRSIEVEWDLDKKVRFEAEIQVKSHDRSGIISEITHVFTVDKISLNGINARTNKDKLVNMSLLLEIDSIQELNNLMKKVKNIPGVIDVYRVIN